jgi:hypothetical protein
MIKGFFNSIEFKWAKAISQAIRCVIEKLKTSGVIQGRFSNKTFYLSLSVTIAIATHNIVMIQNLTAILLS